MRFSTRRRQYKKTSAKEGEEDASWLLGFWKLVGVDVVEVVILANAAIFLYQQVLGLDVPVVDALLVDDLQRVDGR